MLLQEIIMPPYKAVFYNTNIGIIYNESNNKQTAKQYVFCKIGILDSKAGTTQIVIIILLFS